MIPHWKKLLPLAAFPVAIVSVVVAGYFYVRFQDAQKKLANPGAATAEEARHLVERVGKFMELPREEPTVATVTDPTKLQNQAFFANSQTGDKVLIYTQAKKAILFRPSTNKIIDVAPVNIGAQSASQSASPVLKPATFVLLNGTQTVGLTKKYEAVLKSKIPDARVLDRDNAKGSYEKSVLVNVSGSANASEYASRLGVTLAPLPAGETTPSADFLLILGEDKNE